MCHGVIDTGDKFIACDNDTGYKFIASDIDAGDQGVWGVYGRVSSCGSNGTIGGRCPTSATGDIAVLV
jgi:hypothetical protein